MGLVNDKEYFEFINKKESIHLELERLEKFIVYPTPGNNERLKASKSSPLKNPTSLADLLRRPEFSYTDLILFDPKCALTQAEVAEQVEIHIKYNGYIQRQEEQIGKLLKLERMPLPRELNFKTIPGLTAEVREKLDHVKPVSIGQASRISGITPAAISILMVYMKKISRGQ